MWITRDKDGDLKAWNIKPLRDSKNLIFGASIYKYVNKQAFIHLQKTDFPEVTWENSPVAIKRFALTKRLDLKIKNSMKINNIDFEKTVDILTRIFFLLIFIIGFVKTITYIDSLEKQIEERDKIIKELTIK